MWVWYYFNEVEDGFCFITSRLVWKNCVYNESCMMIPGTYEQMRRDYD
jgi:hypothetical protein